MIHNLKFIKQTNYASPWSFANMETSETAEIYPLQVFCFWTRIVRRLTLEHFRPMLRAKQRSRNGFPVFCETWYPIETSFRSKFVFFFLMIFPSNTAKRDSPPKFWFAFELFSSRKKKVLGSMEAGFYARSSPDALRKLTSKPSKTFMKCRIKYKIWWW